MRKKYSTIVKHIYLIIMMPFFVVSAFAQVNQKSLPSETEDDTYVYVSRNSMQKSPAYTFRNSTFFTTQVNIDVNGNNIVGDAANEPSIAVDPTNPNRMVIGWRQFDTITSNFRQAGYGYSTDGGLTWTFPGVINPGIFRSDPVLDFDANGNFYYNSLRSNFFCDVYKIDDGGFIWGNPVLAKGGDKQWMRIDKTDGIGSGNNYSNWNESFSTCDSGDFTRSTDESDSFEDCVAVSNSPRWGTLAIDADGNLFIVGVSNDTNLITVIRSSNAKDPNAAVSWDNVSTVDLDGSLNVGLAINPQGLLGQLWIDIDVSEGVGNGNIYVLGSVSRFSNSDLGDVMFAKSIDGGLTFSAPTRINTDIGTNAIQWFGTMSVAPNGRIDVVWLDTRDAPNGTVNSSLYYSFSVDQGETWSVNEELSLSFDPTIGYPQQNKMGDYFDMVSDNNSAHLAWTNTINGGQDVYYAQITPSNVIATNDNVLQDFNLMSYPNPFTNETTISFFADKEEQIKIEVYNLLGQKINTLLNEKILGNYQLKWDGKNENGQLINDGMYIISLQTEKITTKINCIISH